MFREQQSGRERKRVFDECVSFFGEIIKETGFVRSRKRKKPKKYIQTKKETNKNTLDMSDGVCFRFVFLSKIGNSSLLLLPAV